MTAVVRWIGAATLLTVLGSRPASAQSTANPHGPSVGACATCHLSNAWRPVRIRGNFRHAEKTFPLDGAHATAKCTTCHTSLVFAKAPTQCATCHKDVHRGELGVTCARCHSTRSFVDQARLARLHEETRFPLHGAHMATPCESCHPSTAAGQRQFTGRPTTCIGCHRPDYDRATTPPHASAGFPTTCVTCHTETAWRGAPFDHNTTQFPLTGGHQAAACSSCHSNGVFKGKSTTCVSCHQPDFDRTTTPPHRAAAFSTTCTTCHTTARWLGAGFDHNTTQFPLTGGHQAAACSSCHGDGVYHGKPTTCVSCHQPDFDRTTTPPHRAAAFSITCTSCHTTARWLGAVFDHNTTQFPLTGGHQAAACASCHGDGVYHGKPTTCVTCHRADYDRATNPAHTAGGYSTDCTTCHTTTGWQGANFNHSTTQFPLTGAHLTVNCASCHADGVFRGKPTACVACHRPDYDRTATPPHAAAAFLTTCTTCHTTTTWQGGTFDHGTTQFPLTGGHNAVPCASCHGDGVYHGKPTTCVTCHRADYDRTTNPAHGASGYSTDCTTCHTANAWQGATFNHSTTQFPLTGAHLTVACASCHADGVFRGKPTACVACHRPDYDRTTNPAHAAAAFSTTCTTCHTTTTWLGALFDHSTTQFPLAGAHLTASCTSCHSDGVFRGKPTACVACHRPDYDRTTNPPHAAAAFSTTCTTCHSGTTTWQGGVFNHSTTQFPLTGAHLTASCGSCHSDGVYHGKPTTCVSCHRTDYDHTTNPAHAAAGYSTDCTTCHTGTTTWQGATFNHNATQFPLTGAHLAVACSACHSDGVFRGKPTSCVSCHQPQYNTTTTPPHGLAGFSTTCATCHNSTTWLTATWDHASTGWALTGIHTTTPCASCHGDGVYHGKSTACSSCHLTEYNATTNPNHRTAFFPTACESCHTTTTWLGATFDHDARYFPIYSGAHRGRWTTCADCHTTSSNYAVFTCITCHQKTTTDSHHHGVSGYQYQSSSCYSCHPRGRAG